MYVHLPLYAPENFLKKSKNGRYGAVVAGVDWATSVIVDELKNQGIDDNTLIIFTSDNGSNTRNNGSNAPLRDRKGTTWEGGQRVPCILKWPKNIPANSISDELISSIDFLATISSITGVEMPDDRKIDSIDFSEIIYQPDSESNREYFFIISKIILKLLEIQGGNYIIKKIRREYMNYMI